MLYNSEILDNVFEMAKEGVNPIEIAEFLGIDDTQAFFEELNTSDTALGRIYAMAVGSVKPKVYESIQKRMEIEGEVHAITLRKKLFGV